MSLIPTNNNNNNNNSLTSFTPFPQHFWDNFFSFPFPSFPFPIPTVPYSELSIETSGTVNVKLECKQLEEAHLIVAELPNVDKHELNVVSEEDGFVRISGSDFCWRLRLPGDANVGMLSWSIEDGVLTVLVPKLGLEGFMGGRSLRDNGRPNVRVVPIEGSD